MRKTKYDWAEIQDKYDSGKTWRELMEEYGFGWNTIFKARKRGVITSRTLSEASLLEFKNRTEKRVCSEETKAKISKSRSKYLLENPDQVPYLLNHYSKGDSYPEKYFKEVFEVEGVDLDFHHRVGLYEIDFYNLSKMIAVEIDGEQHYVDPRIVESDKRRTAFLENNGWTVVRIRWSEYQKKQSEEKKIFVSSLKEFIQGRTLKNPVIVLKHKEGKCLDCNKKIYIKSIRCRNCAAKLVARKVERPEKEDLLKMVWEKPTSVIAKEFGVSDNAVAKWCFRYGIEKPSRGYWQKVKTLNNKDL